MTCPFFTPFNRPPAVRKDCGPCSTVQEDLAPQTEVSAIVARFSRMGVSLADMMNTYNQMVATGQIFFDDCVGVDFSQTMDKIAKAKQDFAQLPADIRKRFGDCAENLIDFVSDPANYDEGVRLGLLPSREDTEGHNVSPAAGGSRVQADASSGAPGGDASGSQASQ